MNYKPTLRMSLLVAMLLPDQPRLRPGDRRRHPERSIASSPRSSRRWSSGAVISIKIPELSGQEVRTAQLIADHLRALGLEVRTGVGGHGVVGLLRSAAGKGRRSACRHRRLARCGMTGLPFASKARQLNMGVESPVMHACGHDGHTAMLMGVAEVLAGMREQIPHGEVHFPTGRRGNLRGAGARHELGAKAMVEDGALENPRPDAAFALHIIPNIPSGTIGYRQRTALRERRHGAHQDQRQLPQQTHGAFPWNGVDPIVTAAQVITALQTVVSRQLNISKEPAVLSIGQINGGNRENIVPESVEMVGTLRAFDEAMRADAKARITRTAESIAAAGPLERATAEVSFGPSAIR